MKSVAVLYSKKWLTSNVPMDQEGLEALPLISSQKPDIKQFFGTWNALPTYIFCEPL